jgi:hypothetical protein
VQAGKHRRARGGSRGTGRRWQLCDVPRGARLRPRTSQQAQQLRAARTDARTAAEAVALLGGQRRAAVLAQLGARDGDGGAAYSSVLRTEAGAPWWVSSASITASVPFGSALTALGSRSISVVPHCQQ